MARVTLFKAGEPPALAWEKQVPRPLNKMSHEELVAHVAFCLGAFEYGDLSPDDPKELADQLVRGIVSWALKDITIPDPPRDDDSEPTILYLRENRRPNDGD